MNRTRLAGAIVLGVALVAGMWLAEGWPPLIRPAMASSGAYITIINAQVIGVVVASIVAIFGIALLIDGRSSAERGSGERPERPRDEQPGAGFQP